MTLRIVIRMVTLALLGTGIAAAAPARAATAPHTVRVRVLSGTAELDAFLTVAVT